MNKIIPADQAARDKIRDGLDTNFLVEAGAGSGKTTSLTQRMIRLIETGTFKVDEIAAITFTKKAASELKQRFQNKLEEAYRKSNGTEQEEKLHAALMDLDKCFLGTIHSFCSAILRERPVEAGIDPEFVELDDLQDNILKQQAWEIYTSDVKMNDPDAIGRLDSIGVRTEDLKNCYMLINNFPDVKIMYSNIPKPDFMPAYEAIVQLAEKAAASIPTKEPKGGYDQLQKAIRKTLWLKKQFDMSQDRYILQVLAMFRDEVGVTQNRWNSKDGAKQARDEFNQLIPKEVVPVMRAWREYCHGIIMEFLFPAAEFYERLKKEKSGLNFQDLLMKTAKMLHDNPDVREYFQEKYKCLLVDEFQDTDPIQAEIMFYLTGGDLNETDWQKLIPKKGSLFVVGDPKQSIYRFRRADIDTYNQVKKIILGSEGEVLDLTANFRSVKSLGDWFNPVFQNLFPETESVYQAQFKPLDTVRPEDAGCSSGVYTLNIPSEFTKKDEIVREDANSIASYIRWAVDGNLNLSRTAEEKEKGIDRKAQFSDFMIILRYKDSMEVYARALEELGIPVMMTGGSSIGEMLEMRNLGLLLQFLRSADDEVLLVSVLKNVFGISDDDLYQWKAARGRFSIFTDKPEGVEEKCGARFESIFQQLNEYLRWTRKFSPSVCLEKIIIDLGLVQSALSANAKKSKCGSIYMILEMIRKAEADGAAVFSDMVDRYLGILENGIEEELDIVTEDKNAVRIMNLHKAKGLEAPVVFLAHPYKRVSHEPDFYIQRIGSTPEGYFIITEPNGPYHTETISQPENWHVFSANEQKYIGAEEDRLLYVAATRARNMLIISKSEKGNSKNPWEALLKNIDNENQLAKHPATKPNEEKAGSTEPSDEKVGSKITKEMFDNARSKCSEWTKCIKQASYDSISPTGLKTEYKGTIKQEEGKGTVWGICVHAVLEALVNGTQDLDAFISLTLLENGCSEERKAEVDLVIDEFKRTELWKRLEHAEKKLTEVPFSLNIDKEHALYKYLKDSPDIPTHLSGVVDLAFRESDGWVIVDYKTGSFKTEANIAELTEVYTNQVKIYCEVWELLTGEKVKSGQLYFIGAGIRKVK